MEFFWSKKGGREGDPPKRCDPLARLVDNNVWLVARGLQTFSTRHVLFHFASQEEFTPSFQAFFAFYVRIIFLQNIATEELLSLHCTASKGIYCQSFGTAFHTILAYYRRSQITVAVTLSILRSDSE